MHCITSKCLQSFYILVFISFCDGYRQELERTCSVASSALDAAGFFRDQCLRSVKGQDGIIVLDDRECIRVHSYVPS